MPTFPSFATAFQSCSLPRMRSGGPTSAILALGYAGWTAGQLESEIQANGWLTCPADAELIFNAPADVRYELAMRRIGIEPAMLSMQAGHA